MSTHPSPDDPIADAGVRLQHTFDNLYVDSLDRNDRKHAKPVDEVARARDIVAVRAAFSGNLELLDKLMNLGSSPNLTGPVGEPHGMSILHMAVARKDLAMAQMLLRRGADCNRAITAENYFGITPLHVAINKASPELTELLLSCEGIDINAPMQDGNTALSNALLRLSEQRTEEDRRIVRLLLKKGAVLPEALVLQDAKIRAMFESFMHDPRLMLTALAYCVGDPTALLDRYKDMTTYFKISSDYFFQKTVLEIFIDATARRYFDETCLRGAAGIAAEHADYAKNILGFIYQYFGGSLIAMRELRKFSERFLERRGDIVAEPIAFKDSPLLQHLNIVEIGLL